MTTNVTDTSLPVINNEVIDSITKDVTKPIINNLKIEYLFDKMLMDDNFSVRLQESINNIMKDGKIDQYDIPEIIFIISDLLNQQPNVKLTTNDVIDLVKRFYNFIINKYSLIPDPTQAANFDRLLESSIKILMLQPNIKKACNLFISKITGCCK